MADERVGQRRYRRRDVVGRTRLVKVYLTEGEYAEVVAAAAAAVNGWPTSVSGYAAGALVTFARRRLQPELDPLRDAVLEVMWARSAVNRFGSNVNQAVAALNATGHEPAWLADAVRLCARAVDRAEESMVELRRQLRLRRFPRS
jgi:hypothetical protein